MSKKRTTIEEAPPTAAPAGAHSYYNFPGHARYIATAMERSGLPPHVLPNLTASIPIAHLGRILAGLAEMSRRNRHRPLWSNEIDLVRKTLLGVDETRHHYRAAAVACLGAIAEARRAFVMPESGDSGENIPDDAPGVPWSFVGLDPYFRAEAAELGLPEWFVRRARQSPEAHRIATRLGEVHRRYLAAPKDEGRPVLSIAERDRVRADLANASTEAMALSVLAEATETMLAVAWSGFGMEIPATPPPDLPETPGCNPLLNSTKRTRAKPVPYFA